MNVDDSPQLSDENGKTNERRGEKAGDFKRAASQYYTALATNIVVFTAGTFVGFTTILLPELDPSRDDAEIEVSLAEFTWFSSSFFLQPVGAILVGLLAQRIGSRSTLLISSVLFSIACLAFYFADSSTMLLSAQALVALSSVGGPGVTYIVEITEPRLRSVVMATTNLADILGALFTVSLASFMYWRHVCLVNFVFAVLGFAALHFCPNSPYWLASRGRLREAERSLAWLRGWASPEDVKDEFKALREEHSSDGTTSSSAGLSFSRIRHAVKPYLHRTFLLPLASICYIYLIRALMGTNAIQIFSELIFEKIKAPFAKYTTIAIYAVDIIGAVTYISCVNFIGKRRLMFLSLIGAILAYLAISSSLYLIEEGRLDGGYSWVPAVATLFSTFITTCGIDSIGNMLNGELFPSRFRDVGAGIGMFVNAASGALMGKTFMYMLNCLTMKGVFAFFAGVSLLGLITFYYIVPETEGRTLAEIEQHYAGIKKLEKRPQIGKVAAAKNNWASSNPAFDAA